MKLNEIVNQIIDIASNIENSTMFDKSLWAQKKRAAADLLVPIVQTLAPYVTKNCTPSKNKLKMTLRALNDISKAYQIEELKKPIKDLKAYLNSLG